MINTKIILVVTGLAAATALGATPSVARDYPFCRNGEGGPGYCRYDTLEQCKAAISGTAGYCQPNFWLSQQQTDREAPARRARRSAD